MLRVDERTRAQIRAISEHRHIQPADGGIGVERGGGVGVVVERQPVVLREGLGRIAGLTGRVRTRAPRTISLWARCTKCAARSTYRARSFPPIGRPADRARMRCGARRRGLERIEDRVVGVRIFLRHAFDASTSEPTPVPEVQGQLNSRSQFSTLDSQLPMVAACRHVLGTIDRPVPSDIAAAAPEARAPFSAHCVLALLPICPAYAQAPKLAARRTWTPSWPALQQRATSIERSALHPRRVKPSVLGPGHPVRADAPNPGMSGRHPCQAP